MKSLGHYISALKEHKQELAATLNEKGAISDVRAPLKSLVEKTSFLGYGDGKSISFCSQQDLVTIKLCGCGTVNVYGDETFLRNIILSENEEVVAEIINPKNGSQCCYWFDTLEGVTKLDLSNNGITSISIVGDNGLNKLVLYGNSIAQLDCSYCTELQFLHIFDNPLCDSDAYEANLENTLNSLIDRSCVATGSIILYPWYGLEKLICKDSNNNWIKYPNNHISLEFEDNRLYGVVNENKITYYTYKNGDLVNHTAMNRHHSLRKEYELNITLAKNWLFGSAIQYSEDYQYCYYHFRQSGIQDMWETAEKGFGMCIGSIDQFTGTNPEWADLNVKGYFSNSSSNIYSPDHPNWSKLIAGDWQHGDFILSQLVGRGNGISYGLCPNAQVYLVDIYDKSSFTLPRIRGYVKAITENCNTYSSSYIRLFMNYDDPIEFQKMRKYLGDFGKDNIITLSAGNDGDGLQWTYAPNDYTPMYGNYGTDDNLASTENHSTTFFVSALRPDKCMSSYSSCSMGANSPNYGGFTPEEDYISCYGDQIFGYNNYHKWRDVKQGTSMASPNCNGILSLMRIVYSKMFPECSSFGKGSEFMQYVKEHWMEPLNHAMSFAVGMGVPYILAEPSKDSNLLTKFNGAILSSTDFGVGIPFNVIDSLPDWSKQGLTYDFNPKYFARLDQTTFIPIRVPVDSHITAYTNSSALNGVKDANYFKSEIPIGDIPKIEYSVIDDESKINSVSDSFVGAGVAYPDYIIPSSSDLGGLDTFTVQLLGKFTAEAMIPSITEVGSYIGQSVSLILLNINESSCMKFKFTGLNIEVFSDGSKEIKIVTPLDRYKDRTKVPTRLISKDEPSGARYPCGYINYSAMKSEDGDIFVISLTFDKGIIKVYYNGNLVYYIDSQVYKHKLSDIGVNKISTMNDSIDDVLFYKRALSHSEIIRNTIALIQREESQ